MREAQLRRSYDSRQPTGRRCYMFCVAVWQAQLGSCKLNSTIRFRCFILFIFTFFNSLCSWIHLELGGMILNLSVILSVNYVC